MEPIGPLSASAIRQALRQGTLDPFDMGGLEGSAVRQQLVEIDEIFDELTTSIHQEAEAGSEEQNPFHHSDRSNALESGHAGLLNDPTTSLAGQGHLHLAAPIEKSKNHPQPLEKLQIDHQGKRPKQFYLSSGQKNQRSGPLSASEIAAIFRGKSIPPHLNVLRLGPDLKPQGQVSLIRFMRIYGNHTPSRPYQPTSELAKRARAHEQIAKDRAIFLSVLALIMLLAALLVLTFTIVRQTRVDRKTTQKVPNTPISKHPIERVRNGPYPITPEKKQLPTKVAAHPHPRDMARVLKEKNAGDKLVAQRKKLEQEQEQRTRALAKKKARDQVKQDQEKARREAAAALATPKPVSPPAIFPKPESKIAAPPPLAPPPAAPKPAPQPATTPGLADGSMANRYGPLACPKTLITACDGSCTIPCNGPQGPVTIMFFKGVWGPKIEAKATSLYVSGFVRAGPGSGPRIIVNDVQ